MAKNYYETENEIILDVGESIKALKKGSFYTIGLGGLSIFNGITIPAQFLIGMGLILVFLGLVGIFIQTDEKLVRSVSKNMEKKAVKKGKRVVYQNVPYGIIIQEVHDSSHFCIKCGKELDENQAVCGNCGAENRPIG